MIIYRDDKKLYFLQQKKKFLISNSNKKTSHNDYKLLKMFKQTQSNTYLITVEQK